MTQYSYQLYSSRNYPPLSDTLNMISAAGYSAVEGFGAMYEGLADVSALKAELDAAGLTMPTGHFGLQWLETDPEGAMKTARDLGIKVIIVPFIMPEDRPTDAAGWKAYGKSLAKVSDTITAAGFQFGYHNHDFEFVALPTGEIPMALILDSAPNVGLELDVAWVVRGGSDPLEWIERYSDRIICTHVKDIAASGTCQDEDGWADVGHGTVDWPTVLKAARATGCKHFIAEHDNPNDHKRFAERSIAAMKAMEG